MDKNTKNDLKGHNIDLNVTASNCIFCKIANGTIPSQILYSDDDFVLIKDIQPRAPLHYLAIPRSHFATMVHASDEQALLVGKVLKTIANIKAELKLKDYRVVINQGKGAGQSVFHYHVHILGGKDFDEV